MEDNQKGVTLLLGILILSAILAISFSMATILFIEVRTSADLLRTEAAIYGAQGVGEEVLYGVKHKVPNYQPSSQAYTTQTSDNKVAMTSTSSVLSDKQLIDTIPLSANSLQSGKRYDFYGFNPDGTVNAGGGSAYGQVKVTYLNTGNNGTLIAYLCEFNPTWVVNPNGSNYNSYTTPVCSDPNGIYWRYKNMPITLGASVTLVFDPTKQQELILINQIQDVNSRDIHMMIEAFDADNTTPKGVPNFNSTTVDINAANSGVNRRLRTIIPNY